MAIGSIWWATTKTGMTFFSATFKDGSTILHKGAINNSTACHCNSNQDLKECTTMHFRFYNEGNMIIVTCRLQNVTSLICHLFKIFN